MSRVYSKLIYFFEVLLMIFIAVLSVAVVGGIFFRYALDNALAWTDELSGFLLAWITFLGSVTALERGKHINFDGILMVLPRRVARVLDIIQELFLFVFLGVVFYSGVQVTTGLMDQTAVTMPIPSGVIYSIMPLSALLMMIVLIYRWIIPREFATGLAAEVAEAEAMVGEGTQ